MTQGIKLARILTGIAMIASIIWGYWWLTWVMAVIFLFIFSSYYEIIAWGIIYDSLYGLPIPQFYNMPYMFTATSIFLFIISLILKKYLLAYEKQVL